MATSGTTTFSLTVDELLEEALEAIGGELSSAQESISARRSLNLLLIDLENREIPLGKMERITVTCQTSVTTYTLPQKTVAVLDTMVERDASENSMSPLSVFEYNSINNKARTGKPFQYMIDRKNTAPIMYLYPTPENNTDKINMWVFNRIEDVTGMAQDVDISYRYLPALTSGLAYFMSFKRAGVTQERRLELKQEYEERLARAIEEDRERVSLIARPMLPRITRG